MTDKAFAQADPEWLALIGAAREWLSGPIGQFLLDEERRMLEDELGRFFGGSPGALRSVGTNPAVGASGATQCAPGGAIAGC